MFRVVSWYIAIQCTFKFPRFSPCLSCKSLRVFGDDKTFQRWTYHKHWRFFIVGLLYFNEWSGTSLNTERKKDVDFFVVYWNNGERFTTVTHRNIAINVWCRVFWFSELFKKDGSLIHKRTWNACDWLSEITVLTHQQDRVSDTQLQSWGKRLSSRLCSATNAEYLSRLLVRKTFACILLTYSSLVVSSIGHLVMFPSITSVSQ